MSSQRTSPGYANLRIEYQLNAVRVVCTVFSATPAMMYWIEMLLSVSQRFWNQPLMSQPSRLASAPITRISTARNSKRSHAGRFFDSVGAVGAATLMCNRIGSTTNLTSPPDLALDNDSYCRE